MFDFEFEMEDVVGAGLGLIMGALVWFFPGWADTDLVTKIIITICMPVIGIFIVRKMVN